MTVADSRGRTYQFDNHDKTKPRLSFLGIVMGTDLSKITRRLPTMVSTSNSGGRKGLDGGSHARAMMTEREKKDLTGGEMNSEWAEWFMGWPIGWTD